MWEVGFEQNKIVNWKTADSFRGFNRRALYLVKNPVPTVLLFWKGLEAVYVVLFLRYARDQPVFTKWNVKLFKTLGNKLNTFFTKNCQLLTKSDSVVLIVQFFKNK